MAKWDKDKVFRTTKCLSPATETGYPGGFPKGFIKYLKANGWWKENRVYLCSGAVNDPEAVTVDLNPEVEPTLLEDATRTSLPDEGFDCVIIDPPYTKELAEKLYGLGKAFASIDKFNIEAVRISRPGGIIINLSYQVPKRPKGCNLLACVGIYQTISVAHMRCLAVWQKGR